MKQIRIQRRRLDGVLLLDKPSGISSNAALQRAKRALNAAKAGHTGTLDPLASGLLPLCFGEATKFAQVLLNAGKRYTATVRFGSTTETGDAEGQTLATFPVLFDETALCGALASFVGPQQQIPHTFSALKHDGKPHYEYARAGIVVPRPPRDIVLHALTLLSWAPPDAIIDVDCSKGTYVRVLAEDLGRALGSGAHLVGLRRTTTGGFSIDEAVTLAEFEAMDAGSRDLRLLPADAPLAAVSQLSIDELTALALRQGKQPQVSAAEGRYRVYGPGGSFLGLADAAGGLLRSVRLMQPADVTDN